MIKAILLSLLFVTAALGQSTATVPSQTLALTIPAQTITLNGVQKICQGQATLNFGQVNPAAPSISSVNIQLSDKEKKEALNKEFGKIISCVNDSCNVASTTTPTEVSQAIPCIGLLPTDTVTLTAASDIFKISGFIPSHQGILTIGFFPVANSIQVNVINDTTISYTPGPIVFNYSVIR